MASCFDRRTIVLALLCVATLILNAPQLARVFRVVHLSGDTTTAPETALCRILAEHVASGDEVVFVSSGDAREASVERALCQAATWVTMPAVMHNAQCTMHNAQWEMARAIVAPHFDEDVNAAIAATRRFQEAGSVAGRRLWVKILDEACQSADGSSAYIEAVDEGVASDDSTHLQMQRGADGPSALRHPAPNRQTVQPSNRQTAEAAGLLPLLGVCLAGGIAAGATGVFAATTLFSLLLFMLVLCGITSSISVWLTAALSIIVIYGVLPQSASPTAPSRRGQMCHKGVFPRLFLPPPRGGMPQRGKGEYYVPLLVGAIVLAVSTVIALAHSFVTPYGLAITGGRSKLWFLSGGIPGGFFSDAAWRLLEPAYPPGCAALTFGCYGASGICGDWLTQLAPCVFAAVAVAFVASRTKGLARLWLALLFLTPVALMTTGQFYPEPLMALGVLVGWERVRDGQFGGWLLLGAAGWFKNEGLMFLFAAWLAWRIVAGDRARLRDLATAMVLPLTWHVGCRLAGASLNNYVAPWRLSPLRGLRALFKAMRFAFARPWDYGFAYPVALLTALVPSIRREARPLLAALLFAAFAVAFFCFAYACSTADEAWHLSTSLPRLLWTPALILAREVAAICNPERDSL